MLARVRGAILFSGVYVSAALSQDLPADAAAQIRAAWAQARKTWKPDAQFVCLDLERATAKGSFDADFVFKSNSDARLYHIKRGPKGSSVALDQRARYASGLTTKVIDPGKAAAIARSHGMKGNVLTAMLQFWTDPHYSDPAKGMPVGMGIEVWRLVPDHDPNTADPNDPNMKNYYIDAVTGAYYDISHLNPTEFIRNSMTYQNAMAAEVIEVMRSGNP